MTTIETTRAPLARNAVIAGSGLALASIGLAAGLWLREPVPVEATPSQPITTEAPKAGPAGSGLKPERASSARKLSSNESAGASRATPLDTRPAMANSCANCGVIESVRSFQRKGEGSGLGAVAGGVVGGVLGNQVGKGDGRKAMTVIGAVGGGLAGHEIEKRSKSETLYEVRVRMDDGTLRTVTQKVQPAPGSRVVVDGDTLRSAGAAGTGDSEPRLMRTGQRGA